MFFRMKRVFRGSENQISSFTNFFHFMVKVGKSWWRLVSPAIQKQTNICVSQQGSWRVKNFYWNHRLGGTFSVFKSWFYCLVGWINLGWKLKGWRQKQYTTEIWLVNAPRKFGINLRANTIHGLINYKKILKKFTDNSMATFHRDIRSFILLMVQKSG